MDSNAYAVGGRRNRGRGKRNTNKRNNAGASAGNHVGSKCNSSGSASGIHASKKTAGPPPPPQVKLSLRQIGNPTAYGTTKAVLDGILLPLVDACNAKSSSGLPLGTAGSSACPSNSVTTATPFFLEVDNASKRHLIEQEEAVQSYIKEWKSEQSMKDDGKVENLADDGIVKSEVPENTSVAQVSGTIDVVVAPTPRPPSNVPIITLRPLYVVPAKKTRRRGDRPGVLYVLLTAPKIEKVEIPETVPEHGIPTEVAQIIEVDSKSDPHHTIPLLTEHLEDKKILVEPSPLQSPPSIIETPATATSAVPLPMPSTASTKKFVDYSRQVAQGRLLLQNAVDMLTHLASSIPRHDSNSKGQPQPAEISGISIQVETAMSGKTWRWQYTRADRREGTIESTADYKNWLAGLEKQQADLKARPKPTPGGGFVTANEDGGGTACSGGIASGQPIAALVQHLRAKQEDLKRKKAKKKKDNPGTTSSGASKDGKKQGGKGGKGTKKAKQGPKSDDSDIALKKKPKKPTKKRGTVGGRANSKAVAPTTLLKPVAGS